MAGLRESPSEPRTIHGLIRARWILLALAVLLAAVSLPAARNVQYDRSIENMFAADDPLLEPFQKLRRLFGGDEIVIAVYRDDQLLDPEGGGIERLRELAGRLQAMPGVVDVLTLADVSDALQELETLGRLFPARPDAPPIVDRRSATAAAFRDLFAGYTHSSDGRTAAMVTMLDPSQRTAASREQLILDMRQLLEQLPAEHQPAMLAGEPVMLVDGFRYIEQDGRRLAWVTTLLLAATIVLSFRSVRWVLIPIAVVQLALLLTHAFLSWSGLRLSMVSTMLPAIVTVVGVATVVHVIVRFREARELGNDRRGALAAAAAILAAPIFWACTTDAVGFAALAAARAGPVQDFGVMMAVGALMVIVSVVLVVPGLTLLGRRDADPRRAWGERLLGRQLAGSVRQARRAPQLLVLLIVVGVGALGAGIARLELETDFTRNFRHDSPVVEAYSFVETELGGAGVWDVLLPAPPVLTNEYLERVLQLEDRLRALEVPADPPRPALTKVISLADADRIARRRPLVRFMPAEARFQAMRQAMPTFYAALRSREPDEQGAYYFRIMLRSLERQPAHWKQWTIDEVRRIVEEEFPEEAPEGSADVTGYFVLLTNLIGSVMEDQWRTFGAALVAIGLMMCIALRSLRLALIALVPNALPIVVVLGSLGWLGLAVNMGVAMIAAVSLGLSIDSSIHYLTAVQRARRRGRSLGAAIDEVQQTVGRAVVFSTVALIVGFAVLCTSQFVPTIFFGLLVSLAMLGGLAGNLFLLPLLLGLFDR